MRRWPTSKRLSKQYPQARDPRRELGIAYYQRDSYEEAKATV